MIVPSRYEALQNDTFLHISHSLPQFEFFFEPFYVSRADVPEHDERFVGYGFTRNTQVKIIKSKISKFF